jgi:threonine aldolase
MFCLSKGLGAPVGSMLCGSRRFIETARRYRKMLGGGMRQTGWLCSCGLTALEERNIARLREDNENARYIAERLAEIDALEIDPESVHTNFAVVRITEGGMTAAGASAALEKRGFLLSASGADVLRLVTCSRVDRGDCEALADACKELFG